MIMQLGTTDITFRFHAKDINGDIDISDVVGVSTKVLHFTDPAGNLATRQATFTTDGLDGLYEYKIAATNITSTGTWKVQGKLVSPSFGTKYSKVFTFLVKVDLG